MHEKKLNDFDAGFDCKYREPDVHWPSRRGGKKRKRSLGTGPKGEFVDRVFHSWAKGELNHEIQQAIYSEPSWDMIISLCKSLCCGDCSRMRESCLDTYNPLDYDLGLWKHYFIIQNKDMRRLLLVLLFFGKKMRPNGYMESDIRRMAGVGKGRAHYMVKELVNMGFLKTVYKETYNRYRFTKYPKIKCIQQGYDEVERRFIRRVIRALDQATKPRREFSQNEHYGDVVGGTIVGNHPPMWFKEMVSVFNATFLEAWGLLIKHEVTHSPDWQGHKRRGSTQTDRLGDFDDLMSKFSGKLRWIADQVSSKDASQWNAFINQKPCLGIQNFGDLFSDFDDSGGC